MISEKQVITMKVPFPSINSTLAVMAHMYICKTSNDKTHSFVKCQTLKPYMLINSPMQNYIDEDPDPARNPFRRRTRIDCDKVFSSYNVTYDLRLLTSPRPDVCNDLFQKVCDELDRDGYADNTINEDELVLLNNLITR